MDVFDLTVDQVLGLGDKGCCKTEHPCRPCPCDSKLVNLLGLGASNKYKVTAIKIDGGDVCRLIVSRNLGSPLGLRGCRDTSMHTVGSIVYIFKLY